ncbi:dihydroneopterin aldolase [Aspergillus aculeatinus CBS 121060]|uniref:Dihydroneopterin aldolase domain protein n=1 Tax=Aspergillus aculeatinus CBS 121060 TaxID=1448322 RepID=A0ACD1H2X9_9EURO|nr:dihydroneopterin aldolase domain protein [Aspergillus aculeatinus CBS 121060]RAH67776.1 dihydroneopterin aldolase domain protein [Aspergillus aculeatinus CBS 121060]
MANQRVNVHIPPRPPVLDSVRLQNIQLTLPAAPDPWHRPSKPQPCSASLNLSYSSAVAAAIADDVSLSLDYGKLYRRLEEDIRNIGKSGDASAQQLVSIDGSRRDEMLGAALGEDVRLTAGIVANCGLGLLDETAAGVRRMSHVHQHHDTRRRSSASAGSQAQAQAAIFGNPSAAAAAAPPPIDAVFGQCEVSLQLPKALLRAEEGLKYRSVTVWGYRQRNGAAAVDNLAEAERCPVVLEEEFRIDGIRCYCILGVNSHERVEKQAVIVSLEFKGPGQLPWGSTVINTYQAMTRAVAERVEATSFQTVEALATFVARIVTTEFGNERVTVLVQKPSALSFVERSGVQITRSQSFFE